MRYVYLRGTVPCWLIGFVSHGACSLASRVWNEGCGVWRHQCVECQVLTQQFTFQPCLHTCTVHLLLPMQTARIVHVVDYLTLTLLHTCTVQFLWKYNLFLPQKVQNFSVFVIYTTRCAYAAMYVDLLRRSAVPLLACSSKDSSHHLLYYCTCWILLSFHDTVHATGVTTSDQRTEDTTNF